jgi:Flp pilus assembly protein TadD
VDFSGVEAAESWKAAGKVEDSKGKSEAAEEYYRKAIEVKPNYVPAIGNLATMQAGKGNLSRAISLVKQTIKLNPLDWFSYRVLGAFYSRLNLHNRAEQALKRAREIKSDDWQSLYWFSIHHLLVGEKEKSRQYLEDLIAQSKDDKTANMASAEMALYLNDTTLARQYISRAIDKSDIQADNFYGPAVLGYLLWQEGKIDSAKARLDPQLKTLEQKLAEDEDSQQHLYSIFMNHAIRGNRQEAISYLERLLDAGDRRPIDEYLRDPRLSELLEEPRFQQLMQRIQQRMDRQRMQVLAREEELDL